MSDLISSETEDRFTRLVLLEALGLLRGGLADELRAHLRKCEACQAEYRSLCSTRGSLMLPRRRGSSDGPEEPEALKSLVFLAARAARYPIPHDASAERRRFAHPISDRAFVECAPGVRWAVAGDEGMTLVYRIINPFAYTGANDERSRSTKCGIVLEGSLTMTYAEGTRRRLGVWDAYTVAAGVVYAESFHERTLIFEVYTPKNVEYERRYQQQLEERALRK